MIAFARRTIIILSAFFPLVGFAQETVKKTSRSDGNKEVYYVLKSDKNIKQGSYQKFNSFDNLIAEGNYKDGLKDSLWTEYWAAPVLKSKGNYLGSERTGIWEFYNRKGELEQRYDFTKKQIVFDQTIEPNKEKKYKVVKGIDTIETTLQQPPLYIGGRTKMQNVMTKGMNIPKEAIMNHISGEVQVSFIIDQNGIAGNYKVVRGIGFGCDEEALRMAKQIPNNWSPGKLNNEPVTVEYILTIGFKNFFPGN